MMLIEKFVFHYFINKSIFSKILQIFNKFNLKNSINHYFKSNFFEKCLMIDPIVKIFITAYYYFYCECWIWIN